MDVPSAPAGFHVRISVTLPTSWVTVMNSHGHFTWVLIYKNVDTEGDSIWNCFANGKS